MVEKYHGHGKHGTHKGRYFGPVCLKTINADTHIWWMLGTDKKCKICARKIVKCPFIG